MTRPEDFEVTRIVNKHSTEPDTIPSLSTDLGEDELLEGIYNGELAINRFSSPENPSNSVGIFLRVGEASTEQPGDQLVRIGPVYITNDSVTVNSPTVNGIEDLLLEGQLWLRSTDNAFFVHDGTAWSRVTPKQATAEEAGVIRIATTQEAIAGTSSQVAITPALLEQWKNNRKIISELDPAFSFYVDPLQGDDSLENLGTDQYKPFRTIERALLEVARASYLPDLGLSPKDEFAKAAIFLAVGDYTVDNRPGAGSVNDIVDLSLTSLGENTPIQALTVGTIDTFVSITNTLTITGALEEELYVGQQLFTSNGGTALIKAIESTTVTSNDPNAPVEVLQSYILSSIKGSWLPGQVLSVSQLRVYNPLTGGVIVPRGCSIVGADLRKVKIRPRYVGDLAQWALDDECFDTGRTSIFKVTGATRLSALTFTDSLSILSSHHLCTCVEFAATAEMSSPENGYYAKVFKGLGNTIIPPMIVENLSLVDGETEIVAPTVSNTAVGIDGLNAVDRVDSASPYIFDCSLLSRFGLCGMLVDGAKVTGFKSMVTAQFTNVSLQADPQAFISNSSVPGGRSYKPEWRHFSFQAINGGYIQIVSCFVIGSAQHYVAIDGGELSITNSCSNFGDLSLVSKGFSSETLPQDKPTQDSKILEIIRPLPLPTTAINIPFLSFVYTADSPANRLYVDGDSPQDRIAPYSFQGGETLFLSDGGTTEYTATLVQSAPFFQTETDSQGNQRFYFLVEPQSNGIFNKSELDNFPVYIKRIIDKRTQDQRIYWLKLSGWSAQSQRRPVENFILKFNPQAMPNKTLESILFVGLVKDRDLDDLKLSTGQYLLALLRADGQHDQLEDIYPKINVDVPDANPQNSPTLKALELLLSDLGLSSQQSDILKADSTPYTFPAGFEIVPEFIRPSIIRCSGHTWEWQGYLNYSSALPKFQDKVFTFAESFERIKVERNGGRVYCTGMDDNGNFIVGNRVIDLKTGDERTISGENSDSKVYRRLTVQERLLMFPNSTLDLRSTKISLNVNTTFDPPINEGFNTYASQTRAGFVRLATDDDAAAGSNKVKALTPGHLPIYVSSQLSSLIKNIVSVRLSPFADTSIPTRSGSSDSIYIHPYGGDNVALWNNTAQQWYLASLNSNVKRFILSNIGASEVDRTYNVYAFDRNLGIPNTTPDIGLELVRWTGSESYDSQGNLIPQVPPLDTIHQGVIFKFNDLSRRYLGLVRTVSDNGIKTQIELGGLRYTLPYDDLSYAFESVNSPADLTSNMQPNNPPISTGNDSNGNPVFLTLPDGTFYSDSVRWVKSTNSTWTWRKTRVGTGPISSSGWVNNGQIVREVNFIKPATCYVSNLYNTYDVTLTYFFGTWWDRPNGFNLLRPPIYDTNAQCRFLLAQPQLVTAFLDIYNNSLNNSSINYVITGVNSINQAASDSFFGEVQTGNTTANSNWSRSLSKGYNFIQYLYQQLGSGKNYVNEHPTHGMIVITKV
jgi:hypothetical protein